jgi:hypothetical protein
MTCRLPRLQARIVFAAVISVFWSRGNFFIYRMTSLLDIYDACRVMELDHDIPGLMVELI